MTESRAYVTEDLWFPCETCGKQITHHTVHTCFVMNPDILPTLEEWRLVCKMVKKWNK
jgi:deoxycytidylate deaminase